MPGDEPDHPDGVPVPVVQLRAALPDVAGAEQPVGPVAEDRRHLDLGVGFEGVVLARDLDDDLAHPRAGSSPASSEIYFSPVTSVGSDF